MGLLLRGGRVVDPAQGLDGERDLLLEAGRVSALGSGLPAEGHEVVSARGLVLCPGFIDLHVHFREPGEEYKETIRTGAMSAAAGGFTTVCCMPNTDPAIDDPSVIELIHERAETACGVRVLVNAAMTKGNRGEELAEMGRLADAGAAMLSDDAFPIQDGELMRRAMEYARMVGLPVTLHCEDKSLSVGGVMNEGPTATMLGLKGIPAAAEEVSVARNLALARLTGVHLHICHVSTAGATELVRRAKAEGASVTAEACPHHFTLTDACCRGYNTNAKVNPPLRTQADVEAVTRGLADGTLDCIATDHAPHAAHEKEQEFDRAPFGLVGLETAVPIVLDRLVRTEVLTLSQAIERLATNPARVLLAGGTAQRQLGPDYGTLRPGAPADVTVLDLDAPVAVEAEKLLSKSKNTPYDGWQLTGKPVMTIVGGEMVMRGGIVR